MQLQLLNTPRSRPNSKLGLACSCPMALSHPCCDTGPGSYSGPPDGLPAHLRHTPDPPRAITFLLRTSTRITLRIGAPDHHYGLPVSTDLIRIRTTPYGTTPTYSGPSPDSCTSPGLHVGLPGGLSGRQSIPDVRRNISALLRLFSGLRHASHAVSELWIRATFLGITPTDSAPIPDHYGLHGIAIPPS
jgi:hypothetical protein